MNFAVIEGGDSTTVWVVFIESLGRISEVTENVSIYLGCLSTIKILGFQEKPILISVG